MRNWKIVAIAAGVSASIALLTSCGGSDDKSSSGATKSLRAAAPLTAKALSVGSLGSRVLDTAVGSQRALAAGGTTSEPSLNAAVARFQRSANTSAISARGTTTQGIMTTVCTSGTVTITGDTSVYDNCEYTFNNKKYFEDGKITIASVDTTDSSTFTFDAGTALKPYVYRVSMVNGAAPVFEMSILATVIGTNTGKACGNAYDTGYTNSTMNMTGEFHIKEYSSGMARSDYTLIADGLSVAVTAAGFYDEDCTPTDVTITQNGAIELIDLVNSANDTSIKASGLVIHSKAGMTMDEMATYTTSLTGTVEIRSSCFTGSLTFATVEEIVQVMDDEEYEDCPIAGKLVISGSVAGTVIFTSTGGVEIDNGSDGTVDQTFKSCEDANICS